MEERFEVRHHGVLPDKMMVEYWRRGEFVAGIYPHRDGIRIVSRFITGVAEDPGWPPQSVVIKLEGC